MAQQLSEREQQEEDARVLTHALARAVALLELSQQELSDILRVSPATASRLVRGETTLAAHAAEGQLGLLFLRVFRSLDTLVGGDLSKARAWLRAKNHHLDGVPLERLKGIEGLVHVAGYLDAMRGKL